jgi:oligogalacturonide lyase
MLRQSSVLIVALLCAAIRVTAADAPSAADRATATLTAAQATATPALPSANPREWIDPDTGHRVIRISDEPNSQSLYFHYNSYTPEGDKMVYSSPSGLWTVDLTTLGQGTPKLDHIVDGTGTRVSLVMAAWKSRDAYFTANGILYAVNIDTRAIRQVYLGSTTAVNCDGTYVVTMSPEEDPTGHVQPPPPRTIPPQRERMFGDKIKAGIPLTPDEEYAAQKEDGLSSRLENPTSMAFVFTNLQTGSQLVAGYQYAWIDHQQFSPTDPNLLLYAHEGTWHEVDRIWTIRTDGTQQRLMHQRTTDMEIAGHEFWSHDGKTIWFDLQTPRSQDFWIAGVNIDSGKETRYHIDRNSWGVHFNVSRDNQLFASDGGDPTQVAFAPDGEWINLFRVQPDGTVTREKLVNMSKNNYVTGRGGIEPNVSITPDNKWVVFRSNIQGPLQVYAVEIAKAK